MIKPKLITINDTTCPECQKEEPIALLRDNNPWPYPEDIDRYYFRCATCKNEWSDLDMVKAWLAEI